MYTTQEVVIAEMNYRIEQARNSATRAQLRRPSLLRRLFTKAPATRPRVRTRSTPLSA